MNPLADDVLKMVWLFDRGDQRQDAVRDLAKRIDAELEAARKEIERLTQSAELAALSSGFLAHERSENERLREEVRRKDQALRCIAEHPQQEHLHSSGRQCEAVMSQIALIALSTKSTEGEG